MKTLQALQGSNAMIVRSADRAVQTQPKPLRNGALAAILGLLLGVGLAFLRDALNTRVRTAAELQSRLDLPQLGRVPEPRRRLRARETKSSCSPNPSAQPQSPTGSSQPILTS